MNDYDVRELAFPNPNSTGQTSSWTSSISPTAVNCATMVPDPSSVNRFAS